jgi:uncharacterized protein YifN (PemK superfamily)
MNRQRNRTPDADAEKLVKMLQQYGLTPSRNLNPSPEFWETESNKAVVDLAKNVKRSDFKNRRTYRGYWNMPSFAIEQIAEEMNKRRRLAKQKLKLRKQRLKR